MNISSAVVVDSSVVIKWFRRYEELREQALKLRQAYLDGQLFIHVPALLIYEVANVLRYKADMSKSKVQQALQSLFDMGIGIEYINPKAVEKAVEIAYSYDVTIYDATFVALAWQLDISFITADQKLARKLHAISYVHDLADLTCCP